MAKIIIKLEKSDIETTKMGANIMIKGNIFDLIFTTDALDELINDYETIKKL